MERMPSDNAGAALRVTVSIIVIAVMPVQDCPVRERTDNKNTTAHVRMVSPPSMRMFV